MTELAKEIRVRQHANAWSLVIDGQEFPWHVAPGLTIAPIERGTCPGVVLTVLAERVEVEHSLDPVEKG